MMRVARLSIAECEMLVNSVSKPPWPFRLGTGGDFQQRHFGTDVGGLPVELLDRSIHGLECDLAGPEDIRPCDDGVVREGRSPRLIRDPATDPGEEELSAGAERVNHV